MLKHLDTHTCNLLLKIFNACLLLKTIPKMWKQSNIYPISKKQKFSGKLNETRPIILIEHTRKIFTKIITKRLNTIFNKYPILHPSNHVAIPNTSTQTPIVTISHILEDAQVQNKELWLLSQDMSKAYDSIHIPLLKKALQRIQMPEAVTELITDIFTNRYNYVITNFGLTEPYEVCNGIDQGETIAPLMWHIYYDPLLTTIYNNISGYKLNTTYIEHSRTKNLQINLPALAYIDDTI